jgi:hypothetical protein
MDPATSKEAVMHHALGKKEKDNCQDKYKQDLSNSERGWLWFCGRVQMSCHQTFVPARASLLPTF